MSEQQQPNPNDKGGEQVKTYTQADVNAEVEKIAARIRAEERRKVSEKFADYDDLKAKAEGAQTAEERIAALEQEIQTSKREALRAKYAADVPERLRPLLTGTTDDELKAQRDLLIEGESERKKKNNVSPREGTHQQSQEPDEMREFARSLFNRDGA